MQPKEMCVIGMYFWDVFDYSWMRTCWLATLSGLYLHFPPEKSTVISIHHENNRGRRAWVDIHPRSSHEIKIYGVCVPNPIPGKEGFVDGWSQCGGEKAVMSDPTRISLFFGCPPCQREKKKSFSFIHSLGSFTPFLLTFPQPFKQSHPHQQTGVFAHIQGKEK